ncbi:lumican, partial [Betta splendens]|uniref:Lumican n=1 Tax=Betta splendens TaxID=158456 RepID=A0A6P7MKC2_BETSP
SGCVCTAREREERGEQHVPLSRLALSPLDPSHVFSNLSPCFAGSLSLRPCAPCVPPHLLTSFLSTWPTALYCDHGGLAHIPARLPDRTQYLFLQGNNISSLSSSVLGNITGLRWLILDHNQLEGDGLDRAALQNHTRLRHLFANHNKLSSVPSALPSGLRQLRLAHNRISSIGPGAFQNLRNLTLLLLQGNRLKSIAEGDLKGLVRLNMLDLSRNMFSTVPSHLPPSIQQLYLSNNSLSALSKDSFASLLNLKFLRLSHCGLQSRSVHEQSLNLSSLVELDLSYNRLTAIPTVPTSLQYLYMEANEVQGGVNTHKLRMHSHPQWKRQMWN